MPGVGTVDVLSVGLSGVGNDGSRHSSWLHATLEFTIRCSNA